jgi:hypothetical protein
LLYLYCLFRGEYTFLKTQKQWGFSLLRLKNSGNFLYKNNKKTVGIFFFITKRAFLRKAKIIFKKGHFKMPFFI